MSDDELSAVRAKARVAQREVSDFIRWLISNASSGPSIAKAK
jgi:hypothetical protein